MCSAKKTWEARQLTPQEAMQRVAPRNRIFIGSGAAAPKRLCEALDQHGDHLHDNEVVSILTLGRAPYCEPQLSSRFRHRALFIGANAREAVQAGRADVVPVFLSEVPSLFRSGRCKLDVALIQVSPPDKYGQLSLGLSVDVVRAAVESARVVIAEVNPQMPFTYGDAVISTDVIDHWILADEPIAELKNPPPDPVALQIAAHVAKLVPNGATIQTGIGNIPNAILGALRAHEDLGVHTEMFSDGVMELALAGVVNGKRKTLLPGRIVSSFALGSRQLYRWMHHNPAIVMKSSDYVNDPYVIAQNAYMVAINAALAIDLTGQVASDSLASGFYSGIGGQVDFVRGAARCVGGKSIIALRATACDGSVSRIRASLEEGVGVTTSRGDVRWVVTEYGACDLWGKSVRERAEALIELAHPDARGELRDGAKRRHYA